MNSVLSNKLNNVTSAETLAELAKIIFGDSIDYSVVKIFNEKAYFFHPKNRAMAPDGNIYYHPKDKTYSDDFSKSDILVRGTFLHEMTHVWQHQQRINVRIKALLNRNYKYLPLKQGKSFRSYSIEQQGNIVRDYYFLKTINFRAKGNNTTLKEYEAILPFNEVRAGKHEN